MRSHRALCRVRAMCLSWHGCAGDILARPRHGPSANPSCISDLVQVAKGRHCLHGQMRSFPGTSQHLSNRFNPEIGNRVGRVRVSEPGGWSETG